MVVAAYGVSHISDPKRESEINNGPLDYPKNDPDSAQRPRVTHTSCFSEKSAPAGVT